jgi:hypothetical protein
MNKICYQCKHVERSKGMSQCGRGQYHCDDGYDYKDIICVFDDRLNNCFDTATESDIKQMHDHLQRNDKTVSDQRQKI